MRSLKFYYMKATSKVCVCNAGSFPELPLRKSQFQINTHHGGGAYKTAGAAIKGANSKTNLKKLQCLIDDLAMYLYYNTFWLYIGTSLMASIQSIKNRERSDLKMIEK